MKQALVVAWIGVVVACGCTGRSPTPVPPSPPEPSGTSASEEAAPVVARINCTDSVTMVEAPEVRALSDGVTFLIRNATARDLQFVGGQLVEGTEPHEEHRALADGRWFVFGTWSSHGDNTVIAGEEEVQVWVVPPGPTGVACLPGGWEPHLLGELTIVDPERLYVSPDLPCSDAVTYEVVLGQEVPDAARWLRKRLRGLDERDVVQYAGYPAQRSPIVRVTRNGETIGVARLHVGLGGGFTVCRGFQVHPRGFPPP